MAGSVFVVPPASVREFTWMKTDKDLHFVDVIATNAMDAEDITPFPNKAEIRQVVIEAIQPLDFELWFWRTNGYADVDLDIDSFIGWVNLDLNTHGQQIAGAGQYYLDTRLTEPLLYHDLDNSQTLHIGLVNRDAVAKANAAAGYVVIKIGYTPV